MRESITGERVKIYAQLRIYAASNQCRSHQLFVASSLRLCMKERLRDIYHRVKGGFRISHLMLAFFF